MGKLVPSKIKPYSTSRAWSAGVESNATADYWPPIHEVPSHVLDHLTSIVAISECAYAHSVHLINIGLLW